MKTTITRNDFHDAFLNSSERKEQFSYEARNALFDYLEDYEASTGEEMELDIIAICCDFAEFEDLEAFQADYGDEYESIEDIENETTILKLDNGGFVIQQF